MKHPVVIACLLVLACLAVFVPTLGMFQFQNPMERLAIGPALETARQGDWTLPQFEGVPRANKPPLQTWLSMPLLRQDTLAHLSDPDPTARQAAFQFLAWQVRLIPVLINCLLVGAVYGLALQFGPPRYALLAALISVTNSLFLDHVRLASYDPALATWIAFTNFFLALAIFKGRLWLGTLMAAFFLSLAFLTKGPVALLQSVLPALLFLVWRTFSTPQPADTKTRRAAWLPILLAILLFCALILPWFLYFLRHNPDAYHEWYRQVFRDLPLNKPDPALTYLRTITWMLPWTPWLLIGVVFAAVQTWRRQNHLLIFPFFLMAVPLAIMTCFPNRTERYLVPLVPSFALLAAEPLQRFLERLALRLKQRQPRRLFRPVHRQEVPGTSFDDLLIMVQWILLLAAAIFVPIYGRWFVKTLSGTPWFSLPTTLIAIALTLVIAGIAIALQRRWAASLVAAALLLTWAGDTLYRSGWRSSANGTPKGLPLADIIADDYPPPIPIYCLLPAGRHPPSEMPIYLNRVVTPVDSLQKIPLEGQPKILLTTRPATPSQLEPSLPPLPGILHLAQSPLGPDILDAFLLPSPAVPP